MILDGMSSEAIPMNARGPERIPISFRKDKMLELLTTTYEFHLKIQIIALRTITKIVSEKSYHVPSKYIPLGLTVSVLSK
jgi:hypothetical protein